MVSVVMTAFLDAGLVMHPSCGGGGGGDSPSAVPKGGDVVWSRANDPSLIDDQSFGMAVSGTNRHVVDHDDSPALDADFWTIALDASYSYDAGYEGLPDDIDPFDLSVYSSSHRRIEKIAK